MIALSMIALTSLSFLSYAQPDQAFFDKVESIKKDLYKISSHELCALFAPECAPVSTITADQLKKEMSSNTLLVVNVLPEYYHNDCHIDGSINAPLRELVWQAQSWDRSQKIVVYCALDECDAGEKGCILLTLMGFANVFDYQGGIKEWFQLGYPTQGPALSDYLHTKSIVVAEREYELYPATIVCSRQNRWNSRYQK